MTNQECFDQDGLDGFWEFITERQTVWVNRVVRGTDPPWTENETLQHYRFTNVYRELDPGTQYAIQEILERDASPADRVFNLLIYRLIGRSATHDEIGFQQLKSFDEHVFKTALRARQNAGNPVFTGAYLVSGYSQMGGDDKIENVAQLFNQIKPVLPSVVQAITAADSLEDVYNQIYALPGFGRFLSYQVTVDLLYPLHRRNGDSLVPFSADCWAIPGPGAERGLEVLYSDPTTTTPLDAMQWLRENQQAAFTRRNLAFPWLKHPSGDPIRISLANIQNCLCEFYKYHKILHGNGRARRRFRQPEARSNAELRDVYESYPISTVMDHY